MSSGARPDGGEAAEVCAIFHIGLEEDEELLEAVSDRYSQETAEKFRDADIYPKNVAPVVGPGRKVALLSWGFPMAGTGRVVFNARAEGMGARPLFRDCLRSRCLVPASCFYEWSGEPDQKRKYRMRPVGGGLFYMAALWKPFPDGNGGRKFHFVIITTLPSADVARIHSRMPALVAQQDADRWLAGGEGDFLRPFAGRMAIGEA